LHVFTYVSIHCTGSPSLRSPSAFVHSTTHNIRFFLACGDERVRSALSLRPPLFVSIGRSVVGTRPGAGLLWFSDVLSSLLRLFCMDIAIGSLDCAFCCSPHFSRFFLSFHPTPLSRAAHALRAVPHLDSMRHADSVSTHPLLASPSNISLSDPDYRNLVE